MNIALIGYGRMGHEIEAIAEKRGHLIKLVIDKDNTEDINKRKLEGIDVAIEFTTPDVAFDNIVKCLTLRIPVVSGTTGWLQRYDQAVSLCEMNDTSFIHSSNFSIGVNLLFQLSNSLAEKMSRYSDYDVSIEEIHHIKKLDAPSGTALSLVDGIIKNHKGYDDWCTDAESDDRMIPVKSLREGSVPGSHSVKWDSEIDTITLSHDAKNRKGLALGAVVAAEFIYLKKGVFTMNDVLGF